MTFHKNYVSFLSVWEKGGGVAKNISEEKPTRTQIMTPKEAAKYLGLNIITVYRLVKKRELLGFKVGGQWRFKKDVLDSWILSRINSIEKK